MANPARTQKRNRLRQQGRRPPARTSRRRIVAAVTVAVVVLAGVATFALASTRDGDRGDGELIPVASIYHEFPGNHLHGLGFDHESEQLYLATHYGLFLLRPDANQERAWQLFQVGDSRDDFMGFSLHPHNPNIVYTSGHPASGGNLGVLRSDDGGLTFEQIFDGFDGAPIDFHSMMISPANPDLVYGIYWDDRMLYRTRDGGAKWERFELAGLPEGGLCWAVPCLAPDPSEEETLYAGTEEGLMVSRDAGQTWGLLSPALTGPVAGVGVRGPEQTTIFASTLEDGMLASTDGGQSWEPRGDGLDLAPQELAFAFAFEQGDPRRVFLATLGQRVFESTDAGTSWRVILD